MTALEHNEHEHDCTCDLDPGIRNVVALIRGAGFETTDSGDGVSKLGTEQAGCMRTEPHVVVRVPLGTLERSTDLLVAFLQSLGLTVVPLPFDKVLPGEVCVEGVYAPASGVALIDVTHLDDAGLALAQARQP